MRILITGATGFVGSHVVETLTASPWGSPETPGPQLRALVRSTSDLRVLENLNVEMEPGHLGDAASLRKATAGVDVILHLGALTRARTEDEFRTVNESGTRALLEAAAESGSAARFIYVSSLAAVGPAYDGQPVRPDTEPGPLTAYGRSKLAGERACLEFRDRMEIAVLRPPAVYGPRDRDLLGFFKLARLGVLPVPAGPTRYLQLIHATDLSTAVTQAALAKHLDGVYHTAHPETHSWTEVLELVARAVGRRGRPVPVPQAFLKAVGAASGSLRWALGGRPILDRDKVRELLAPAWLCETEAARSGFGFLASIPLASGLRQTADWYRERGWL